MDVDARHAPPSSGPGGADEEPGTEPPPPPRLFMITFNEAGEPTNADAEFEAIRGHRRAHPGITDVVLFVHGWNMPPDQALLQIATWFQEHVRLCREKGWPLPLMVGVYWPSCLRPVPWSYDASHFDLAHVEVAQPVPPSGPAAAAAEPPAEDGRRLQAAERRHAHRRARHWYGELASRGQAVDAPDADQVAALVNDSAARDRVEANTQARSPLPELHPPTFPDNLRLVLVELEFVAHVKWRAVQVGRAGVATVLGNWFPNLRIHLVAHSFGSNVWLAALGHLAAGRTAWRATSLFMIQPAVSQWTFAYDLPQGCHSARRCGAYSGLVAERTIERPIVVAWSRQDRPLAAYPLQFANEAAIGEWSHAPEAVAIDRRASTPNGAALHRHDHAFAALGHTGPPLAAGPRAVSVEIGQCLTDPATLAQPVAAGADAWSAYALVGVQGTWGHESVRRSNVLVDGGPGWLEVPGMRRSLLRVSTFLVHGAATPVVPAAAAS